MKKAVFLLLCFFTVMGAKGVILHVGSGQTYASLSQAAAVAEPGDTVLFHAGVYSGGQFISGLHGTAEKPIVLMAAPGDSVIHRGGSNGWHLSEASHLFILNLVFEQQTGNGFNLDDAGTYESPALHIVFRGCIFRNMNASGNNDLLKLSGLDSFEISDCIFLNGSAGGSGIDMVGCHSGLIKGNRFENMGSNAIQAKGGTQHIRIEANFFKNCGQRAVNLGGSTGLAFFRPIDAPFEAADLLVYSNVFVGSVAPIAYVGCTRTHVVNNTIYDPEKWVIRILQETVDTTRFVKCGNNSFRNNIIYRGNSLSTDCNVGGNTDPGSFRFSNNLWYNYENSSWTGPSNLPAADSNRLVGQNPMFSNASAEDFTIPSNSPAVGKGYAVSEPVSDFAGKHFAQNRSIGAFEGGVSSVAEPSNKPMLRIFPNPSSGCFRISLDGIDLPDEKVMLFDTKGSCVWEGDIENNTLCPEGRLKGLFYIRVGDSYGRVLLQ